MPAIAAYLNNVLLGCLATMIAAIFVSTAYSAAASVVTTLVIIFRHLLALYF